MIPVIIRSNLAGVHYGYLTKRLRGGGVRLERARRVWEWQGAKTLSHAADTGFGTGTKIGPLAESTYGTSKRSITVPRQRRK